MRRKREAGFTLVEVVIAMAILAAIVVPVCSSLLLSLRMNAKAEAVLQARLAVSSAVETLMAEGISSDSIADVEGKYPVEVTEDDKTTYYDVVVESKDKLVSVSTAIRAADSEPSTDPLTGGEEGTE